MKYEKPILNQQCPYWDAFGNGGGFGGQKCHHTGLPTRPCNGNDQAGGDACFLRFQSPLVNFQLILLEASPFWRVLGIL